MKPLRAVDVRRVVGAAGQALTAALGTRSRTIEPDMLNSAGSVSAEWYVETLWHYLFKRALLQGITSLDVVFDQPARPADRQVRFALPHPEAEHLVMAFHVRRRTHGVAKPEIVPVAQITVHRGRNRRRAGTANTRNSEARSRCSWPTGKTKQTLWRV